MRLRLSAAEPSAAVAPGPGEPRRPAPAGRFVDLHHVDLAAQVLDPLLGRGDRLVHALLGGAHLAELRRLEGDLALQLGDPLGDLAGQGLVALGERRAGRALVARRLVLQAGSSFSRMRRRATSEARSSRAVPARVGVADLLVEDAQGVAVDHRRAGVVRRAAEQGEELGEDGHAGRPQAAEAKFSRRSDAALMAFSASMRSSMITVCRVVLQEISPKIS
jgi:hypothetical protein